MKWNCFKITDFNGAAIEVLKWISYLISLLTGPMVIYPYWNYSKAMLIKGPLCAICIYLHIQLFIFSFQLAFHSPNFAFPNSINIVSTSCNACVWHSRLFINCHIVMTKLDHHEIDQCICVTSLWRKTKAIWYHPCCNLKYSYSPLKWYLTWCDKLGNIYIYIYIYQRDVITDPCLTNGGLNHRCRLEVNEYLHPTRNDGRNYIFMP